MKRARALATATVAAAVSLALATPVEAVVADQPDPGTASFNGAVRTVLSVGATTYVGGDFTAANTASGSVPRARVAAIDTATGQLLPFDPGANGPVWSLAADGTDVYLGGSFTAVGGQPRKNIAEVDAVSSPQGQVTGWRASMSSRVRALTVADGVLYAGGQFLSVSGVARSRLAAFDLGTGALTAWAPRADKPVFDLLATPRRIYVAGAFDSINLQTAADSLAALDPVSGDPQSWDPTISYPVRALDTDGTTLFAAATGGGGHLRAFTADTGASVWEVTADGDFQAVTLVGDVLYFGGHMDFICSTVNTGAQGVCLDGGSVERHKIGAVNAGDGTLLPFDPHAVGGFLGVLDLDSTANTVSAGGVFTGFQNGAISQPYYAQFSETAVLP